MYKRVLESDILFKHKHTHAEGGKPERDGESIAVSLRCTNYRFNGNKSIL